MQCRSHSTILAMLGVYNVVSIIVAVILASPFFYRITSVTKSSLSECTKCFFRCIFRRPSSPCNEKAEEEETGYKWASISDLVLSVAGSIVISISAPMLAGLAIYLKHDKQVNLWINIQLWATHPRAASLVYAFTGYTGLLLSGTKIPNGFYSAAVAAILAECIVSLLGVGFLSSRSTRRTHPSMRASTLMPEWARRCRICRRCSGRR
ncbi:hypothetical protein K402DRAFT_391716 [Aulographum hederae CBS 113979]|uniref:Uncharacterized protein n=1 Tax=Aulographum hederae CBS 113979 TaxID=1176131 RepID=A0A6G1H5I7_9PEZI|nr:hypothetical protein K402DRAFT_391716 [Aulographum hederae CBS 113979]